MRAFQTSRSGRVQNEMLGVQTVHLKQRRSLTAAAACGGGVHSSVNVTPCARSGRRDTVTPPAEHLLWRNSAGEAFVSGRLHTTRTTELTIAASGLLCVHETKGKVQALS